MADIKLFHINDDDVHQLVSQSVAIEKSLQTLIEKHLEAFLGVRFLYSEYSTGKMHGGRIDTLGIDENGYPVIIEYKRALNENVINQGLYYLNWLVDHKGEFELLVLKQLGASAAEQIEWSNPRVICIAGDFTKFDEHAVQQISGNIELIRYRKYGEEFLLFELVNAVNAHSTVSSTTSTVKLKTQVKPAPANTSSRNVYKTVSEYLEQASSGLKDLFHDVETFVTSLGDDIQKKVLQNYIAYKRIKNFVCVEVKPQTHQLLIYLKLNPDDVVLEEGFTRDVRKIGHFSTGDLEVRIRSHEDFERAKSLIITSYEVS